MEKSVFKPRQRVGLNVKKENGVLNLPTHIETVKEGGYIVPAPIYMGKIYPFLEKELLDMEAILEGSGKLSCSVVVNKKLRNNNIVMLDLEQVSDIKKTQRRKYYRLPTLLDSEVELDNGEKTFYNVTVTDISAGGVRFSSSQKFYKKEHLKLKVKILDSDISLRSKVIDSVMVSDIKKYDTRIQFESLNIDQEQLIVAYIFEEQMKRRRR